MLYCKHRNKVAFGNDHLNKLIHYFSEVISPPHKLRFITSVMERSNTISEKRAKLKGSGNNRDCFRSIFNERDTDMSKEPCETWRDCECPSNCGSAQRGAIRFFAISREYAVMNFPQKCRSSKKHVVHQKPGCIFREEPA